MPSSSRLWARIFHMSQFHWLGAGFQNKMWKITQKSLERDKSALGINRRRTDRANRSNFWLGDGENRERCFSRDDFGENHFLCVTKKQKTLSIFSEIDHWESDFEGRKWKYTYGSQKKDAWKMERNWNWAAVRRMAVSPSALCLLQGPPQQLAFHQCTWYRCIFNFAWFPCLWGKLSQRPEGGGEISLVKSWEALERAFQWALFVGICLWLLVWWNFRSDKSEVTAVHKVSEDILALQTRPRMKHLSKTPSFSNPFYGFSLWSGIIVHDISSVRLRIYNYEHRASNYHKPYPNCRGFCALYRCFAIYEK